MSDIYREQHPLLNEDLSDEEQKPLDPVHRSSPIVFRGYARNSAKGAAAIIRTWPDSLASLLPYIWTMLAVTGIVTFVFYNTITVALLPAYAKALHQLKYGEDPGGNGVYMHMIVQNRKETEKNEYYHYIQKLANQYQDYRFYLIYLFNDTIQANEGLHNERERSDVLKKNVRYIDGGIVIKKLNLSNYMDASPLGKVWRGLPQTHLEFLVRAVSIWQKGGLAFNPVILTEKWHNTNYTKKMHEFLGKNNHTTMPKRLKYSFKKQKGKAKRVNNIQDIINNAEDSNFLGDNMIGEESIFMPNVETKVSNNLTDLGTHNLTTEPEKPKDKSQTKWEKQIYYDFLGKNIEHSIANHTSLLPMFLDFIFHAKPDIKLLDSNSVEKDNPVKHDAVVEYLYTGPDQTESNSLERKLKHVPKENLTAHKVPQSSEYNNEANGTDVFTLLIDLKGYMIATRTHCHSFLGTLFSNARYLEESRPIKDLIIGELTRYCEGVLSMCEVIDVIW